MNRSSSGQGGEGTSENVGVDHGVSDPGLSSAVDAGPNQSVDEGGHVVDPGLSRSGLAGGDQDHGTPSNLTEADRQHIQNSDSPLQDDPAGNAIPGVLAGGIGAGFEGAASGGFASAEGREAIKEIIQDVGGAIVGYIVEDHSDPFGGHPGPVDPQYTPDGQFHGDGQGMTQDPRGGGFSGGAGPENDPGYTSDLSGGASQGDLSSHDTGHTDTGPWDGQVHDDSSGGVDQSTDLTGGSSSWSDEHLGPH